MHLSLLSDSVFSDRIDAEPTMQPTSNGRAHRDGLVRGLLFMVAVAIPFCLAVATGHSAQTHPSSGYAQSFADER